MSVPPIGTRPAMAALAAVGSPVSGWTSEAVLLNETIPTRSSARSSASRKAVAA
ncbi:MAG: hypothetical protein U0470_07750 [Anaerolineae bacterium]